MESPEPLSRAKLHRLPLIVEIGKRPEMTARLAIQPKLQSAIPVRWEIAPDPVPYDVAVARMEHEVEAIAKGDAAELVWLLEHPPLYTAGTSAKDSDLIMPALFPVHHTGRGGQYTITGPGSG